MEVCYEPMTAEYCNNVICIKWPYFLAISLLDYIYPICWTYILYSENIDTDNKDLIKTLTNRNLEWIIQTCSDFHCLVL